MLSMNLKQFETSFKDCLNNLKSETERFSHIMLKKISCFKTSLHNIKSHIQLSEIKRKESELGVCFTNLRSQPLEHNQA